MQRLARVLEERDARDEDRERVRAVNQRLCCAAAAETRRWRSAKHEDMMPFPSLISLAECVLGEAFCSDELVRTMRPLYDVVDARRVPSALDHNDEHCRVKRKRPAVEDWSSA